MRRLFALLLVPLPLLAAAPDTSTRSAEAMRALLEALAPDQRDAAQFSFQDRERRDLRLAPVFLEGLDGREMSGSAREELSQVLDALLSEQGRAQVAQVRALEPTVREIDLEKGGIWRVMSRVRDSDRYFLALFGAPGPAAPWGYRFDGHHLSINATFVPGQVPSVTPFYLGSQPRVLPGDEQGRLVLASEEELARQLLTSLDQAQRAACLLPFEPGRRMFEGTGERVEPFEAAGLPRADMNDAQKALLDALIDVYLDRAAPEIADAARARYRADGLDHIRFAWAGGEHRGEPHYYRVHGPRFLVEFDNSLPEADHIHSIWRELDGDFGEDLLREHYQASHAASQQNL